MSSAYEFLRIATDDLKAAYTLYDQQLYSQAVFSLQQSVEKSNKAFLLIHTDLSVQQVFDKVRHKSLLALKNFIKERIHDKDEHQLTIELMFNNQSVEDQKANTEEFIKKYSDKKYISEIESEILEYNERQIQELLDMVREDHFIDLEKYDGNEKTYHEKAISVLDFLQKKSNEDMKSTIEKMKMDEGIMELLAKKIYELLTSDEMKKVNYTIFSLLILGALTQPHAVKSRYPDESLSDYYSDASPIIKKFSLLLDMQKTTLQYIINVPSLNSDQRSLISP